MGAHGRLAAFGPAAAAVALLAALTFALYGPALGHYFIADDLTLLAFVRGYRGSWLAFLVPGHLYSDPVTRSRYLPLTLYYHAALDALLGGHALAYHLVSLSMHAAVGALVGRLAWSLYRDRAVAAVAAALFVGWRLQSQAVAWIATGPRLPSTGLALLCLLWAREGRGRWAAPAAVAAFALALPMNAELAVMPAILASFLLGEVDGGATGAAPARRRQRRTVLLGCTAVTALFLLATWRSEQAFPARPATLAPDLARVLLFTANLFVPFAVPLALKLALATGAVTAAVWLRDRRLRVLLSSIAASALLWGMLRPYPLMPRYLYLAWAFGAIVVARVLCLAGAAIAKALPGGRGPELLRSPERRRAAAAAMATAPLLALSAWSIRSVDLVHQEYLALLPCRLARVQAEARASGRRLHVFVRPSSHLGGADLAYFEPELQLVPSPAAADRIVDTDLARYRDRLGPRMADRYWFLPWFDDAIARSGEAGSGRPRPTRGAAP